MNSYLLSDIPEKLASLAVEGVHKPGSLTQASGAWISAAGAFVLEKGEYPLNAHEQWVWLAVERGDIVAIQAMGSDEYYDVKRVIGLPGDKIAIVAGRFVVNDKELEESYGYDTIRSPGRMATPVTLGDKEYFVVGDNVNSSEDSRFSSYGNVQQSEIRGKVFYRLTKGRRGKIGK